jgi:hypothetical protein
VTDYGIHAYHNPAYWTVANNTVVGNGRGILVGPQFVVTNNISYGNKGSGYAIASGSVSGAPTFAANLSYGNGSSGARTGVTVADPMFANAPSDDYRLRTGSPGINRGVATGAPLVDFAGFARPLGGAFDIGAYEQ